MRKVTQQSTRRMSIEQLECRRLLTINPTADEQEVLQYINRFRVDPAGEFSRLFSSASPLVARDSTLQADLDFFKVNGALLQSEWSAIVPTQPVTWNEAITNFSAGHNNNMIAQNQLFHSDSLARRTALLAAAVNLDVISGQRITSEIVFGQIKSPLHNYASYSVDWGVGSGGMETTRSHRVALVNSVFEEIGGKITDTSASNLKPKTNAFVLANIQNAAVRVSGAVFEDRNNSGWYEAGEGLGSVSLLFEHTDGRKFNTTAFSAGGYQIELPAGTYKIRVTGGSMQHAVVRTITVGDKSQWQNFIYKASDPAPDVYEPNDASATATTLTAPTANQNSLSLHSSSDVDWFKYVSVGTGIATYELQFTNSAGNIDLQLLNASGQVLASSATTGNGESIQFQADAGNVYFLKVFGAANSSYSLKVNGPEALAPDSKEPNDSTSTATALSGVSPSLNGLNLHTNKDVDVFKYVALANGSASFAVAFDNSLGNIDLQLLDGTGNIIASSTTTGNGESITRNVQRDATYFVRVFGGPNRNYSLSITGPQLQAPTAVRDQAVVTSDSSSATLNVLANDSDPDGSLSGLTPSFTSTPPSAFTLNTDKTVTVRSPERFTGVLRATYLNTDPDGLRSSAANIDVFVLDFTRQHPWQNPGVVTDVSSDGLVTPSDALLIINYLNSGAVKLLPVAGSTNIFGFLDVKADGIVSPSDALQVINQLNRAGGGEGEASSMGVVEPNAHDTALVQMLAAAAFDHQDSDRRSRRST